MDLNYLFYRQQIERSRAETAGSEPARKAHAEMASRYEMRIGEAAETEAGEAPRNSVNPTLALAMTAREVDTR
jgi:hypothetical protein